MGRYENNFLSVPLLWGNSHISVNAGLGLVPSLQAVFRAAQRGCIGGSMEETTTTLNSIASLAKMYAAFFKAAYDELVAAGCPTEMANQTALLILEKHIDISAKLAAKKDRSLSDLLAVAPLSRGGTA